MMAHKTLFQLIFLLLGFQSLSATTLEEQFKQTGYLEICDKNHGTSTYDSLYKMFDDFIEILQCNPVWAQKLYIAKERFIRSKDRNLYSTDILGFYDESQKEGRSQIAFYYAIHFHEFIYAHNPEFNKVPEITHFFDACKDIQESYRQLFDEFSAELGLKENSSILFKVIKYFPSYIPSRPHYDGTAFSLFLDSTDNQSLLLSPYNSSLKFDDFFSANREFSRESHQNSILLIPGTLLTEFFIYPTPHIVIQSGKIRYAAIAFAMRPHYNPQKIEFAPLPNF